MAVISAASGIPMAAEPELKTVGKQELDRTDFLTMFITQLQYQDPMKPMDSYEMASQLAQFSNMEATMKMSDNMEKLLDYQTSQNNLELLSLLDKEVQGNGNMMGVNNGETTWTEFTLTEAAETCAIEIFNAAGHLVRKIDVGSSDPGLYELDWDGKDMRGDQVEDGLYTYHVKAMSPLMGQVEVDYRTTGKVTGVNFEGGEAIATLDGYIPMDVGSIINVVQPKNQEEAGE